MILHQRAQGMVRIAVERGADRTRLSDLRQQGCLRACFPRADGAAVQAVLLNTSGGITDGDRLETVLRAGTGSVLVAATQAAERVYRAREGAAAARVRVGVTVNAAGRVDYLPQETILFDGGALERVLRIDMAADAVYVGVETLLLGRVASGEVLRHMRLRDTVMLRRDGRLVLYDSVRLEGRVEAVLGGPATARGAGAVASLIYAAADAGDRLGAVRGALEGHGVRFGASVRDGVAVARVVAADGQVARRAVVAALGVLREGMPCRRCGVAEFCGDGATMHLTPREKDKLLIAMAASVARRRLERGVKLNHPEAVALITDYVVEGARDGSSVADLMQRGAHVLTRAQVIEGVAEMIPDVQVEATFPDGTKLVTVHEPIR